MNSPNVCTKCWWAMIVFWFLWFSMCQVRSVLSSDAENKYFPLGWNLSCRTQLSCPTKVKRHNPELVSHIFIVLSRDPETKKGPSFPEASIFELLAIDASLSSGAHSIHSTTLSWSRRSSLMSCNKKLKTKNNKRRNKLKEERF